MPAKPKAKYATRKNFDKPADVLRYKAAKIQVLIRRMDKLAESSPSQVNIGGYIKLLDEFAETIKQMEVRDGKKTMAREASSQTPPVGERTPAGLDAGVSADNPFAG